MTDATLTTKRTVDRMQVKIEHLDTLLGLAGEVIITAANLQDLERRTNNVNLDCSQEGNESLHLIKSCNQATRRISQDLHDLVMAIRLVEIDETFRLLRRPVRDLCRNLGRDAEVEFEGSDTLIDKALAEHLVDPLLHLLRNAIDHGLETSIDRKRADKSLQGKIVVTAHDAEHDTFIRISDDGRGIDEAAVRARAGEMLGEQAVRRPLLDLICEPGLSTAAQVTGTSGRGVGLDLVRNVLAEFDGELRLETEPGRGCIFTLRVPKLRAVNIIDALTLRAGETLYALPIEKVTANIGLNPADVNTAFDRGRHITHQDRIIPLLDLQGLLDDAPVGEDGSLLPVIILRGRHGEAAFVVSEFLGPQKLVNIPLDDDLEHHQAVAGTTVFTGGKLGLTLDVDILVAAALGEEEPARTAQSLLEAADDVAQTTEIAISNETAGQTEPTAACNLVAGEDTGQLIDELKSSLGKLQDSLLTLEREPENEDELNHAFRRLHAAKGHLSLLEAEAQSGFAHQLETALDYLRSGRLAITPQRMDLMLDSVSYLVESAAALPGLPDSPPAELLDQLAELTANDTIDAEDGIDYNNIAHQPFELSASAQLQVLSALKRNERTYETYLRFDSGRQPGFLAAYLLLRRVGKAGTILATLPDVADLEQGRCGREVKVLWSTSQDESQVDALFDRLTPLYNLHEHRSIPTTIFTFR